MEVMRLLTYGICLVVFCLPLYLLRFEIFSIPTTALEVMIYVLFIVWLVRGFKLSEFRKLPIAILLILVGVSLATVFSSDLRTSVGIWKGWFIDPLLFFVVVISVVKNSEQVKKIFHSLFLSGTVVAIISLIYLIQGNLDPAGRLQAFYNSPNYLAMYLAPALIIGICTTFNVVHLLAVVCLLLSIFFTKSFGAWLGILAVIALISGIKQKRIILILMLIAILALGFFAITQRPSSFEARIIIWQKTFESYKNNPVIGIGPGISHPHNIFLAFLLQTGLIGFIGFIWLLAWFYKKKTSIALMSIMTYILVHGLVDTTYWKNDLSALFWLIIALCYIAGHRACSRKTDNLPREIKTAQ